MIYAVYYHKEKHSALRKGLLICFQSIPISSIMCSILILLSVYDWNLTLKLFRAELSFKDSQDNKGEANII